MMKKLRQTNNTSAATTAQRLRQMRYERRQMMSSLMEAGQREAQMKILIERLRAEKAELMRQHDMQTSLTEGLRREVELRHSEIVFAAQQVDAVLAHGQLPPAVEHAVRAASAALRQVSEWDAAHKPELDPASWLALAKQLGIVSVMRQPALRGRRDKE